VRTIIKVIGQVTRRVYAEGDRASCFRQLQKKYTYQPSRPNGEGGYIYPEPLLVLKKPLTAISD